MMESRYRRVTPARRDLRQRAVTRESRCDAPRMRLRIYIYYDFTCMFVDAI